MVGSLKSIVVIDSSIKQLAKKKFCYFLLLSSYKKMQIMQISGQKKIEKIEKN